MTFYNPQVKGWSPALIPLEKNAKDACSYLLYVIDGRTRATASLVEAAAFIGEGREVSLVIQNVRLWNGWASQCWGGGLGADLCWCRCSCLLFFV